MYGSNSHSYSDEDIAPDQCETEYADEYERTAREIKYKRRNLIATAASVLIGHFGADLSPMPTSFSAWSFYNSFSHVDYQYGQWPVTISSIALKKGYYQASQQTRWKTLQKRYEKKIKRAKGKVPVYPY